MLLARHEPFCFHPGGCELPRTENHSINTSSLYKANAFMPKQPHPDHGKARTTIPSRQRGAPTLSSPPPPPQCCSQQRDSRVGIPPVGTPSPRPFALRLCSVHPSSGSSLRAALRLPFGRLGCGCGEAAGRCALVAPKERDDASPSLTAHPGKVLF